MGIVKDHSGFSSSQLGTHKAFYTWGFTIMFKGTALKQLSLE
jgi:hypothetical protein